MTYSILHVLPSSFSSNTGALLEVLAPMVESAQVWIVQLHYLGRNTHLHLEQFVKPLLFAYESRNDFLTCLDVLNTECDRNTNPFFSRSKVFIAMIRNDFRGNKTSGGMAIAMQCSSFPLG